MHVETTTLPNGLLVATVEVPDFELATAAAFIPAGSRNEVDEENGVAHFLEHMAFKGTERRSSFDIAVEVEKLGSDINAWTSRNRTAYHSTGLSRNLGVSVDIIGDVLTSSAFPAEPLEVERGVVLQEISRSMDSSSDLAHNALLAQTFPGQPLGRTILGDADFIRRASPDDFRSFTRRHYSGENMLLIGAGEVDHEEFVDHADAAFRYLGGDRAPEPQRAVHVGGVSRVATDRFNQVNIYLGFESVPLTSENAIPHRMLASVVGGAMSSPLFQEIRVKRGLVYSVGAFSSHGPDYGLFAIRAGTSPEHVEELLEVACREMMKAAQAINPEDLVRTKNAWLVRTAKMLKSPSALASHLAERHFSHGDLQLPGADREAFEAVTPEQVSQAAAEILKGRRTIAMSGPAPDIDYEAVVERALAAG